jgi:hypothetical protein
MADTVTLRTRKFMRNALLGRKQMVVYVMPRLCLLGNLEKEKGEKERQEKENGI